MKMLCKIIEDYLNQIENGIACKEQKAMAQLVRNAFANDDIYVDEYKLEKYMSLEKYFSFDLFPWERFLICIWDCTYWRKDNTPRWDTVFAMVGRGAGKDGFISFDSFCSLSPYNDVDHCDVDICANNEDQAIRPMLDLIEVLENPEHEQKLKKHYYHTKEIVRGVKNKGNMKGHTNNPKGRDGLRPAKIIFNEVHQYEDYKNIEVFTSALGKRAESRTGFFTSNGHISDGVLDAYLKQSEEILFEGKEDKGFFPFICRLNDKEDVHDPTNWQMANPSLPYLPALQKELEREYEQWKLRPEEHIDFLVKRMGLRVGVQDIMVTSYENIKRTNKPLPNLKGWECVVGIDYALLNDWASVNLHFKKGNQRYDINHAWVCEHGRDLPYIKAPWQDWARDGLITVVSEPTIEPKMLCGYIREAMKKYKVKMIAMDFYRATLFTDELKQLGFDKQDRTKVKLVRPSDIMQVATIIDYCFENDLFSWGDSPHLRWATNNTKRTRKSKGLDDMGNFVYAKIDSKTRKTDMFMALAAAMTCEESLKDGGAKILHPPFGAVAM